MTAADYLMLISMVCIWALMAINVFLSVGGFLYYHQCSKTDGHVPIDEYPFVSIMVPAHNESVVIRRTVRALLNFDYPHDRYEIIVINDNSTDDTANVLKQIQAANPDRNLIVVNTDNVVGGKGKSNALNIGYSVAKGSVFAIYDADNTPEPQALRILVENLMSDSSLGAVIALALGVTVPGSEYGGTMLMAMAFAFLSLVKTRPQFSISPTSNRNRTGRQTKNTNRLWRSCMRPWQNWRQRNERSEEDRDPRELRQYSESTGR